MISITTAAPTGNDAIIIAEYKAKSQIKEAFARISKVKTLDGGVVVTHNGFSDGDRSVRISASVNETVANTLWSIFTTQTFITIAIEDGVYNAAIKMLKIKGDNIQMTIEIESKLS